MCCSQWACEFWLGSPGGNAGFCSPAPMSHPTGLLCHHLRPRPDIHTTLGRRKSARNLASTAHGTRKRFPLLPAVVAHKGSAEGRGVSSARFSTLCGRGQTLTLPSNDFLTRETALIQRMECANGFPLTTALAAHRVRRRHNLHQAVQAAGCSQPNPGRFWGLAEEARLMDGTIRIEPAGPQLLRPRGGLSAAERISG